jgi:hypothetical protein
MQNLHVELINGINFDWLVIDFILVTCILVVILFIVRGELIDKIRNNREYIDAQLFSKQDRNEHMSLLMDYFNLEFLPGRQVLRKKFPTEREISEEAIEIETRVKINLLLKKLGYQLQLSTKEFLNESPYKLIKIKKGNSK